MSITLLTNGQLNIIVQKRSRVKSFNDPFYKTIGNQLFSRSWHANWPFPWGYYVLSPYLYNCDNPCFWSVLRSNWCFLLTEARDDHQSKLVQMGTYLGIKLSWIYLNWHLLILTFL